MLEIIPHDLERNQCEMMALVCLCMLTSFTIRNIRTQLHELILMIMGGTQTSDGEEEEEIIIIPIEEGGAN